MRFLAKLNFRKQILQKSSLGQIKLIKNKK